MNGSLMRKMKGNNYHSFKGEDESHFLVDGMIEWLKITLRGGE